MRSLQQGHRRPHTFHTVSSHTRWASVGAITEPNCHPVDNTGRRHLERNATSFTPASTATSTTTWNSKRQWKHRWTHIPESITTDTKIIPLQIEHYLKTGVDVAEAFRLAVNDFQGSHAISMHTDLAPGKFFLAQKGSGQAVFVGWPKTTICRLPRSMASSKRHRTFLKMNGEQSGLAKRAKPRARSSYWISTSSAESRASRPCTTTERPSTLTDDDIKTRKSPRGTSIARDSPIISQRDLRSAPFRRTHPAQSLEDCRRRYGRHYVIHLDESTFPPFLEAAFDEDRIRRVFFVGQGTAGVAAQACADILKSYLADPTIQLRALKASELADSN
jgi:glucosamine--fructose-6-phosphate aminotransferase (isomerizing)